MRHCQELVTVRGSGSMSRGTVRYWHPFSAPSLCCLSIMKKLLSHTCLPQSCSIQFAQDYTTMSRTYRNSEPNEPFHPKVVYSSILVRVPKTNAPINISVAEASLIIFIGLPWRQQGNAGGTYCEAALSPTLPQRTLSPFNPSHPMLCPH